MIREDQAACMGCLSHCGFSSWKDHDDYTTGRLADPRSFCIQKTLQDIAHGGDTEQNLMFAGHAAYRFKQDPFYSNNFTPDGEAAGRSDSDRGLRRVPSAESVADRAVSATAGSRSWGLTCVASRGSAPIGLRSGSRPAGHEHRQADLPGAGHDAVAASARLRIGEPRCVAHVASARAASPARRIGLACNLEPIDP